LSLGVGGIFGILLAFVKALFEGAEKTDREREKLDEIQEHLIPARLRREPSAS
jgi:hypothetical protein